MKCYNLKTIILGDCGVGKTTMLYKYYNGSFNYENESTVGVNFVSKYIDSDKYEDVVVVQIDQQDKKGLDRLLKLTIVMYVLV